MAAKNGRRKRQAAPAKANKKAKLAYHSDGSSDEDGPASGGPIPLASLETAGTVEVNEDANDHDNAKTQAAKSTKKRAEKIVWRKFDRENEAFEKYYKQLLQLPQDEWHAFLEGLKKPMPVYVRINGNYLSLSDVVAGTLEMDFDLNGVVVPHASGEEHQVSFGPVAYDGTKRLWKLSLDVKSFRKSEMLRELNTYFHTQAQLGTLMRQEPASTIIAHCLDLSPGQSVLDLCGGGEHRAPLLLERLTGQKDGSITSILGTGRLVVNEKDAATATNSVRNLSRTAPASTELMVTAHAPLTFPEAGESQQFDRVVCCAPCSGDGFARKNPEKWRTWTPSRAWQYHSTQISLVKKGMRMVKVGGSLLYVTRSFNQVENEAVVAELLRSSKDSYELVDTTSFLSDLNVQKGRSSWDVLDNDLKVVKNWKSASDEQKKRMRPSMWAPSAAEKKWMKLDKCVRLLPHQNDTNGLFLALLRKKAVVEEAVEEGPVNPYAKKPTKAAKKALGSYTVLSDKTLTHLQSFFGLPEGMEKYHFMEHRALNRDREVHVVSPDVSAFASSSFTTPLNIHRAGVMAFHPKADAYDITDDGAHLLLPLLSERVLQLSMDEFAELLSVKEKWLKNVSESTKAKVNEMQDGSFIVVLDDMHPIQTEDQDFLVVATKRHSSYSLSSSAAAVSRVQTLMQELNVDEEDESDAVSDDADGYESLDMDEEEE